MGHRTFVPAPSPSLEEASPQPGERGERVDIVANPEDVAYVEAALALEVLTDAIAGAKQRMNTYYELGHFMRARHAADDVIAVLGQAQVKAQVLREAFDTAAYRNPPSHRRKQQQNGKEAA